LRSGKRTHLLTGGDECKQKEKDTKVIQKTTVNNKANATSTATSELIKGLERLAE
jgi:hypothetical protein